MCTNRKNGQDGKVCVLRLEMLALYDYYIQVLHNRKIIILDYSIIQILSSADNVCKHFGDTASSLIWIKAVGTLVLNCIPKKYYGKSNDEDAEKKTPSNFVS